MTPYYSDDACTIYHGDALELMAELGDIDVVVTSPPYNLGTTTGGGFPDFRKNTNMRMGKWTGAQLAHGYASHSDDMTVEDYEHWQEAALRAMWATLSSAGAIFYNHKPRVQADGLRLPFFADLPLRQIITWDRDAGMNFAPTHFLPRYEWVLLYAKPAFRLVDKASGLSDVWRFGPERVSTEHPAPFPIELPRHCLKATTGTVLDPFMGSGTTLRAAKDLGRKAIGIEIEERYCEIAARRLGQEVLAL
jgi:site-specific DNA-methyltransferase (adenine-specific)